MPTLEIKPTHKVVADYYANLAEFEKRGIRYETAVRSAFHELLEHCARQFDWKLVSEYRVTRDEKGNIASDPNRMEDEEYIVRLIGQVISVSLETQKLVGSLPSVMLE